MTVANKLILQLHSSVGQVILIPYFDQCYPLFTCKHFYLEWASTVSDRFQVT